MAGHNKWSKVKHKKARVDAKRSKVWTKLIREITVASRMGGPEPADNARLRKALDDAKAANMPKETVQRAVDRGAGKGDGADYEELVYEGYGPHGVALLIECATDNRNRTSGEIRSVLTKNGGNLGTSGSVSFMFDKQGQLLFEKEPESGKPPTEDALLEIGMEHGADDVADDGDAFMVTCAPEAFLGLDAAFKAAEFQPTTAEVARVPQSQVKLEGDDAKKCIQLIDKLEDLDDVQNVWSNFDIDESELEKLMA
jgi:YebC/PmpR family DNA-binding regulatory protein